MPALGVSERHTADGTSMRITQGTHHQHKGWAEYGGEQGRAQHFADRPVREQKCPDARGDHAPPASNRSASSAQAAQTGFIEREVDAAEVDVALDSIIDKGSGI